MKIVLSNEAIDDTNSIYKYISRDSIKYARKTIEDIRIKIRILKEQPYIGRKVPEFDDEYLRELLYKSYRIIYEIEEDTINIKTVLHGSKDLNNQHYKF